MNDKKIKAEEKTAEEQKEELDTPETEAPDTEEAASEEKAGVDQPKAEEQTAETPDEAAADDGTSDDGTSDDGTQGGSGSKGLDASLEALLREIEQEDRDNRDPRDTDGIPWDDDTPLTQKMDLSAFQFSKNAEYSTRREIAERHFAERQPEALPETPKNAPEATEEHTAADSAKEAALAAGVYDLRDSVMMFDHVVKDYDAVTHALKDVSINIRKGEFVFLVGSSGSGKSTFIRLLLKEIDPTSGRIYVNNREITRMRRRQIPKYRRGIGCVFQSFRLLKDRTIYENVAFAQRIVGVPEVKIRKNVMEMLMLVGLEGKKNYYPRELSGGEQQRVAIARALVNKPVILLADEPTGNLDPEMSWDIMKLLEEVNKNGTTVVVVTHNQDIVNRMQKRVVRLKSGCVVDDKAKGGYSK